MLGVVAQAGLSIPEAGALATLLTAVAGGAYWLGQHQQEAENRGETVGENEEQMEEVISTLSTVETTMEGFAGALESIETELEANRRDIHYQYRLVHDQVLGDNETCQNPNCVFCYPEDAPRPVDIPDPIPREVRESFDYWDNEEERSDS
jgi:hypothetical protein